MSSNMYSDNTIDGALARRLQSKWSKAVRALARVTNFKPYELQAMCLIFHKICSEHEWWGANATAKRKDHLDSRGFRDSMSAMMEIQDASKLEALFRVIDRNNKRYITKDSWIKAISGMRGTKVERSLMCWQAFDARGDGQITRNDMFLFARKMFLPSTIDDFDGFCKEFVDVILKDTKAAKDGFMSLQEYLDIVNRRPLFREFLDTVLPLRPALMAFFATLLPDRIVRKNRKTFVSQFYFL